MANGPNVRTAHNKAKGRETMSDKCTEICTDLKRLELQVTELQNRNGTAHKELRERLSKVEMTNAIQNERYDAILEKLDALTNRHDTLNVKLEALEAKPGKRWESIAEKAIWAVVAAVIAFLLGRVGL